MLYVRLTIKVKVGIPESVKVRWYPHKITGSSHLNCGSVLHIPIEHLDGVKKLIFRGPMSLAII